MSINKSILRSAGIIGIATFFSRLLGFIRDVVIARLFGVYVYAQAFVIAFRIPNLLRDLVGEGAANAAFVPVFSEYKLKHTKEEFWELANVVLNILLVVLTALTLLGIMFSPLIVRLIAPGFVSDPVKLATTIRLTRIIFPYILLISLAAYSMAILNSLQHFSVPAFSPCLLNVSIIVFALLFGEGIQGLASGILIGGILQLVVQVPVLYKKGFRINSFLRRFKHPAAVTIGKLMFPRLLSSCIYQLNNFVDSIFGSLATIVGEGGVAILYFAYRLIQFPLGIFSNALSQAILPEFSTQALEESRDKLKHTLLFGLRSITFVMVPVSIVFMVLSRSIISTLFMGGKFDVYSADMTANALFFYSIGLFAYGATKILQSCFFALKDTVTPTKVSGLALGLNIILNFLLMFPLRIAGLALATSISGISTCFILFFMLRKKLGGFNTKEIAASFLRILAASICMGIACYFVSQKQIFPGFDALSRALELGLSLIVAFVSYVIFCFIFRVQEIRQFWQWLLKRKL
ncbi:MAG: murein biosynthesis integral membrane protein MurJ [Candidatus Omnitrophica bacterium]|nr:murein biosynthesis integral membrane protein MurJ [Candidatus Omnitrophota bacterium]